MAVDLKLLVGNAIKEQRSALGISQEELASRAGLHRTYVSEVERGERNPSIASIEKLAQALEVSFTSLFDRTGQPVGSRNTVEILLVEDNPIDIELTKNAFKKAQITNPLHVVNDGEAALDFVFATGAHADRLKARPPQLILLDLNLPNRSGLEVLREIKADPRTQNIPVIILTISDRDSDINECRRLGAETYIVKPVSFQNFSKVTNVLSLSWVLVEPNGTLTAQPNVLPTRATTP
ncbi:MAG TPA: response regulator [Chthoniobacterales bacterium]|nr:response regulator [Chthoniobacterales bacterium]